MIAAIYARKSAEQTGSGQALLMSTMALFVGYGVVRASLAMRRRQDAELGS